VRDVRLSALRYQLNPHFLFNSLNAVSTLVLEGNPPAATHMLAQIGEFLRTMLDNEAVPETPLSKESYSPKSIWRSSKPDSVRGCGLIWPSPRKL
jgi:LytS/YehU family sensor histidine kinase